MINFDSKVLRGSAQGCRNSEHWPTFPQKAGLCVENTFSVNSKDVEDGTQHRVALFDFVLCIASGWLLACPSSLRFPAFTMLLRLMEKDFSAQMEFFIHFHRLWEITFYYSRQMFFERWRNCMKTEAFCVVPGLYQSGCELSPKLESYFNILNNNIWRFSSEFFAVGWECGKSAKLQSLDWKLLPCFHSLQSVIAEHEWEHLHCLAKFLRHHRKVFLLKAERQL